MEVLTLFVQFADNLLISAALARQAVGGEYQVAKSKPLINLQDFFHGRNEIDQVKLVWSAWI